MSFKYKYNIGDKVRSIRNGYCAEIFEVNYSYYSTESEAMYVLVNKNSHTYQHEEDLIPVCPKGWYTEGARVGISPPCKTCDQQLACLIKGGS